ncbi:hypothetical protein H4S02_001685 [Coemansia sp. RSA 2611]|nr:hypothetical protein H4S02_001685 [Coemansia sp. RSA 2611]
MSIAKSLPQLVLQCLFSYIIPLNARHIADWKAGLALIAVCRSWRSEAECQVYGTAHIKRPDGAYMAETGNHSTELVANFDVILANRRLPTVRRLTIDLNGFEAIPDFERVSRLIASVSLTGLPQVTELTASLYSWYPVDQENNSEPCRRRHLEATTTIIKCLPNVTSIGAFNVGRCEHAVELATRLVNAYAGQLQSLRKSKPLALALTRFGEQLQRVHVADVRTVPFPIPLMPARSITRLRLTDLPLDATWQKYFYGFDKTTLAFPKLQKLLLLFSKDLVSSRFAASHLDSAQVLFPALTSLEILDSPCADVLFQNANVNPNLSQLTVRSSISTICGLRRAGIMSVDNLSITIYQHESVDAKTLADTLNYFYGNVRSGVSLLNLHTHAFDLDAYEIRWSHLWFLSIRTPIAFSTVVRLIPCMPMLRNFVLPPMVFDQDSDDLLSSDFDNTKLVLPVPLSQNIRIMFFAGAMDESDARPFKAIRYLVLRCPKLEKVCPYIGAYCELTILFDDVLRPQGHFTNIEIL